MAGNMRPRVDRQTAPTSDINGPSCGIATAMATVTDIKICYNKLQENIAYCFLFFIRHT